MKNKVKHAHYWSYLHAVWDGHVAGTVAVGRYCSVCGKMQTSLAKNWRSLPRSYVDMREKLEKAMKP